MAAKVNVQKLKQDAAKEESAGRIDKAIALFRQVIDESPGDPKANDTWKKLGDLYARQGQNRDASDCYAKVGDFFERDGFIIKAIAVWKQIAKLDASDLKAQLKLADLYAKQNLPVEAKNQYQTVVDEYIKRGRAREAGEALKRIRDIDPTDLKVRSRLADLYLRDGDPARAVEEYIAIAEELNKKGHMSEALQVLEKGLKIAPASEVLRLEIGRIHLVQKSWDKAIVHLEEAARQGNPQREVLSRLGEAYLGGKRLAEAEAVFKRLIEKDPQDTDARAQLGRLFLVQGQADAAYEAFAVVADRLIERREGDRAAAVLSQILQRQPGHIQTLLKLRDVYMALRKEPLVISTYVQLSEAYTSQQRNNEAAAVLEELIKLEPGNSQHRSKLEFVRGQKSGSTASSMSAGPSVAFEEEFGDPTDDVFAPASSAATGFPSPSSPMAVSGPAVPAKARIALSGVLSREDEEFVLEHLQEGKVFSKYGLSDKAAEEFEAIVNRFPDHVEARTELRELLKAKGAQKGAAEQCLALAEIARLKGDGVGAGKHETEARELCPELFPGAPAPAAAPPQAHGAATKGLTLSKPSPPELSLDVEEEGISATPEESLDEEFNLSPSDEGDELSDFLDEAEAEETPPRRAAVPAPVEEIDLGVEEEVEEAELDLSVDDEDVPAPPPPRPPRLPEPARAQGAKLAAPRAKPAQAAAPHKTASIQPRSRLAPPPPPSLRPGPAPTGSASHHDLAAELRSLEESLALGFDDEAQETAAELVDAYPDHPVLLAKLAELGLSVSPLPAPASVASAPASRSASPKPAPLRAAAAKPAAVLPPAPKQEEFDLGLGLDEPSSPESSDYPEEPELPAGPASDGLYDFGGELGVEQEEPLGLDFGLTEESAAPSVEDELGLEIDDESAFGEAPGAFSDTIAADDLTDLGGDLDSLLGGVSEAESVAQASALQGSSFLEESGLADMFQQFKKGVDKQLGREDYETRYNLGIAYKEMGLVDEAIGEFQLAARDEARFLDCASMLGLCFLEKGMPEVAISWFERGLEAPDRNEEEYLGLRLELARAHEAAGNRDEALIALTSLQEALESRRQSDPQLEKRLREVTERILALGGQH